SDGEWHFFVPQTGWRVWVEDEARFLVRHGSGWRETTSDELQNLALLGVGATADANNPLLAKLNDALFTAVESANGGSGDLRVKLNKEAGSNFLSLLFQNGYS
ncbi:MAG TPA: hypothetical protein DDZ43_03785, partial [Hyphomonadaceae bacterium]|nr:hypothetical protein [Hyphomonadaceae bacterium]